MQGLSVISSPGKLFCPSDSISAPQIDGLALLFRNLISGVGFFILHWITHFKAGYVSEPELFLQ